MNVPRTHSDESDHSMDDNPYTFEYHLGAIHQGAGSVAGLKAVLRRRDLSQALTVSDGSLAGISKAVILPDEESTHYSMVNYDKRIVELDLKSPRR